MFHADRLLLGLAPEILFCVFEFFKDSPHLVVRALSTCNVLWCGVKGAPIDMAACEQELAETRLGFFATSERFKFRGVKLTLLDITFVQLGALKTFMLQHSCAFLSELDLSNCPCLTNLEALRRCTLLRSLRVVNCDQLDSLAGLADCAALTKLDFSGCGRGLTDLRPLSALGSLQVLAIRACHVTDLSGLSECYALRILDASFCLSLVDVSAVSTCAALENLDLCGCSSLADVSLAPCASLCKLDLSGCVQLTTVARLSGCASLQILDVSDCCELATVAGLAGCASLHTLDVSDCRLLLQRQVADPDFLRDSLPMLSLIIMPDGVVSVR